MEKYREKKQELRYLFYKNSMIVYWSYVVGCKGENALLVALCNNIEDMYYGVVTSFRCRGNGSLNCLS